MVKILDLSKTILQLLPVIDDFDTEKHFRLYQVHNFGFEAVDPVLDCNEVELQAPDQICLDIDGFPIGKTVDVFLVGYYGLDVVFLAWNSIGCFSERTIERAVEDF